MIVDESASPDQREALEALDRGEQGGAYWEIFAAVCPNRRDTITGSIEIDVDREARIPGIAESRAEPIKNPVSGEEHRARIAIPDGFEYHEAEMANTVEARVTGAQAPLAITLENTYAQLNAFDWNSG
jgi:hypothetical protein